VRSVEIVNVIAGVEGEDRGPINCCSSKLNPRNILHEAR